MFETNEKYRMIDSNLLLDVSKWKMSLRTAFILSNKDLSKKNDFRISLDNFLNTIFIWWECNHVILTTTVNLILKKSKLWIKMSNEDKKIIEKYNNNIKNLLSFIKEWRRVNNI